MFGFIVTYSGTKLFLETPFRNYRYRLLPKVNVVQFLQYCSECKVGNFLYHLLNLPVFSLLSSWTNNHGKPDNKWKVPSCWFADSGKILTIFQWPSQLVYWQRLLPSPRCPLKRCSLIPGLRGVMLYLASSTLPIWRDMFKWITVGTETHACIETENYATLFFMVNMISGVDCWHRCDEKRQRQHHATWHPSCAS